MIAPQTWDTVGPAFTELSAESLTDEALPEWLHRWSNLEKQVWEMRAGLKRANLHDVTNEIAQVAFQQFVEGDFSNFRSANQQLTLKLLAFIGEQPSQPQFIRRLRVTAELFRKENGALLSQLSKREAEYGELVYSMMLDYEDKTCSVTEVEIHLRDGDRSKRETAWRAIRKRLREDREPLNGLFLDLVAKRHQLALNVGLADYRAYRWREMLRLDYTPEDCLAFHAVIEVEVIPIVMQLAEKRRVTLGVAALMPWDMSVDMQTLPPITPFNPPAVLEATMHRVFTHIDSTLGEMFGRMRDGFLDLEMRVGKPPGGEEWFFPVSGLPFIRLETNNTSDDVSLLLHECGHAFHDYLTDTHQDLIWAADYPTEFSEFVAISMTYLAAPFLEKANGGFYSPEEAARLNKSAIEEVLLRWLPFITMVDAFQHHIYSQLVETPEQLDALWLELSQRFMPWIDWQPLSAEQGSAWQRIGLLYEMPFYFLEYGLAHLGALRLWHKAQSDGTGVWKTYRDALTLGGTLSLPELYRAAGSRLPFTRVEVHEVMTTVRAFLHLPNE